MIKKKPHSIGSIIFPYIKSVVTPQTHNINREKLNTNRDMDFIQSEEKYLKQMKWEYKVNYIIDWN